MTIGNFDINKMIPRPSEIEASRPMEQSKKDNPLGGWADEKPDIKVPPLEEGKKDNPLGGWADEKPEMKVPPIGEPEKDNPLGEWADEKPEKNLYIDEIKTDDNGQVYTTEEGKLKPNTTYELNGFEYKTDEQGRIISCEGKPKLNAENDRDIRAQQQAGGADRKEGDQGGHIIGRDMNGDGGLGNLIAMEGRINQSDYKCMENEVKAALAEGKDVTVKTECEYVGDSERPSKITTTVTIDGKETVYKFDNDFDGTLLNEVPEEGMEVVMEQLDETDGTISSVKKEYDENGNLVKTTVTITYTNEDGNTDKTEVVIENEQGDNNG